MLELPFGVHQKNLAAKSGGCKVSGSMRAATNWLALRNPDSRRGWALLCLVLFLTLQGFAGSTALHKAVHADATAPNHHCLITLFAQGQLTGPVGVMAEVVFVAIFLFCLPPFRTVALASRDYRLSPSRAPPRS
jgi:hypothetical protein